MIQIKEYIQKAIKLDNDTRYMQGLDAHWQTVQGITTHKFLVYSAYYDMRNKEDPVIRVIGVTRKKDSEKVMCRLYYYRNELDLNESYVDINAEIVIVPLPFIRNSYYHDCHVLCHLNLIKSLDFVPDFVSIISLASVHSQQKNELLKDNTISNKQKYAEEKTKDESKNKLEENLVRAHKEITNRLPVINSRNGGTGTFQVNSDDVGVCVKPIHHFYNQTLELITFIELNKILGVTKLTIYNESVSDDVACVLKYYIEQENLVSIMQWDLPSKIEIGTKPGDETIFHRAALSALNDCIYRNMNNFHYLMQIDLDEFIIPHMHDTIPEMLKYIDASYIKGDAFSYEQQIAHNLLKINKKSEPLMLRNNPNRDNPNLTSSYNFKNAYFYLQFGKNQFFLLFFRGLNSLSF